MVMQRKSRRLSARQYRLSRAADQIANLIDALPEAIEALQYDFDEAQHTFDQALINLSVDALALEIFGPAGQKRAASNDTERKMAIEYQRCNDVEFRKIEVACEEARRKLQKGKLLNDNYCVTVRLIVAQLAL